MIDLMTCMKPENVEVEYIKIREANFKQIYFLMSLN